MKPGPPFDHALPLKRDRKAPSRRYRVSTIERLLYVLRPFWGRVAQPSASSQNARNLHSSPAAAQRMAREPERFVVGALSCWRLSSYSCPGPVMKMSLVLSTRPWRKMLNET